MREMPRTTSYDGFERVAWNAVTMVLTVGGPINSVATANMPQRRGRNSMFPCTTQ